MTDYSNQSIPLTPDWLLCDWVRVAVGVLRNTHSAFSNMNGCVISLAKINLPSHQQSCQVSPLLLVLLTTSWSIGGLINWWDSFDYIKKKTQQCNKLTSWTFPTCHLLCDGTKEQRPPVPVLPPLSSNITFIPGVCLERHNRQKLRESVECDVSWLFCKW